MSYLLIFFLSMSYFTPIKYRLNESRGLSDLFSDIVKATRSVSCT